MNISIVIPAKGHSKRVENKNLYRIGGESLVHRACRKVLECRYIHSHYLDTEDPAIIKDCADLQNKGLKFIHRPKELATNFIGANELMMYALHAIPHKVDLLLQTFATSPLITAETIDECIEKFLDQNPCDSFFTVKKVQEYFWTDSGPYNFDPAELPNSFELEPIYEETHGLYGIFTDILFEKKTRVGYNPKLLPISKIEALDIDTYEDLEIAERLLDV